MRTLYQSARSYKKIINYKEATNMANETTMTFIDVMEGKEQPTLKAIAEIFEVPAQRLYSIAKQPIAGQVYDAKVYNWEAISRFIEKRIGKEGDKYATFEDVYEAAIAKDAELAQSDKRRGPRGNGTSKVMIDLGDGKTMPARRKEVDIGDKIYLKRYDDEFEVVYLTATHVVLKVVDSTILNCLSNWTFNQQLDTKKGTDSDAE
jgi:hypothetical protein